MKKKIILDCDPGIDDSLAIALCCASNEIELRGVTAVVEIPDGWEGKLVKALDGATLFGSLAAASRWRAAGRDPERATDRSRSDHLSTQDGCYFRERGRHDAAAGRADHR